MLMYNHTNTDTGFKPFYLNSCWDDPGEDTVEDKLFAVSGNVGNKYLMYAILRILYGINIPDKIDGIKNIFGLSNYIPIDYIRNINNNFSHIIFNCQDQLRTNISYYNDTPLRFKIINNFIKKIQLPMVVFGLGANCFDVSKFEKIAAELHPEQILFLKLLSEKSISIGIRGCYTQKLLEDLNIHNFSLVGCPTFFINGANKKSVVKKDKITKIVICGDWIPYHQTETTGYRDLRTRDIFHGHRDIYYFLQDEVSLIKHESKINDRFFFSTDIGQINRFFADKDLTIGARVHGSIISLNNGVPAICTNFDSRAVEMCGFFGIPHIRDYIGRCSSLDELYNTIDLENMNRNYIDLLTKFHGFLEQNRIPFAEHREEPSHAGLLSETANPIKRIEERDLMMTEYRNSISRMFERGSFPEDAFYIHKVFQGRKIIVYGAGESFHYFKEVVMRYYGYTPSIVLDRKFSSGDTFEGIPAFSPSDYKPSVEEQKNSLVIVCLGKQSYFGEVIQTLRQMGFANIISLMDIYEIHNPFSLPQELQDYGFHYYLDQKDRIESCLDILEDDHSRDVYLRCIQTHLHRKAVEIPMSPRNEQYTPKGIPLARGYSRFIYCGVSVGDLARVFGDIGKVDELVCFEPDPNQFRLTADYIATNQDKLAKRVTAIPCAVFSHDAIEAFTYSESSYGSRILETGEARVQAIMIDHVLPRFRPTFINMDIEGSELEALKGAEKTLLTSRPDLAICVYHAPNHFWDIPLYLHSLGLGYRFFLRNYTSFIGETVLYATS